MLIVDKMTKPVVSLVGDAVFGMIEHETADDVSLSPIPAVEDCNSDDDRTETFLTTMFH